MVAGSSAFGRAKWWHYPVSGAGCGVGLSLVQPLLRELLGQLEGFHPYFGLHLGFGLVQHELLGLLGQLGEAPPRSQPRS